MLLKNKFTRVIHYENVDSNLGFNKELNCLNNKLSYGEGNSLELEISKLGLSSYTFIYNSNNNIDNQFWSSFKKNDILFIDSKEFILKHYGEILKLKSQNIIVIIWDGTFYDYSKFKDSFNLVLTCSESFKKKYQALDINCEILYFSFSTDAYKELIVNWNQRKSRPAFLGSINIRNSSHFDRIDTLFKLRNEIDLYLNFGNYFILRIFWLFIKKPTIMFKYLLLFLKSNKPKFGIDYFEEIGKRKIIINNHLDQTEHAANIRILEITGMHALMITDTKKGIFKILPKNSMILYNSPNEILDYLNKLEDEEMYQIAKNGFKYVKDNYSPTNRAKKLTDILMNYGLINDLNLA